MMKSKIKFFLVLITLILLGYINLNAQRLVESVVAIVGNEVIYLSDLENTVADLRRSGRKNPVEDLRCNVFQEMLVSKLFVDQARIDSIEVTDDAVEGDGWRAAVAEDARAEGAPGPEVIGGDDVLGDGDRAGNRGAGAG
jgi:hypothetical protein